MNREKGVILYAIDDERIPGGAAAEIAELSEGRELVITIDDKKIETILDRIEIGFGDVPFYLVPKMPRLKWIQLWSAGADWLQKYPETKDLPFTLTTASGIHGRQIAEHCFAMILAWNRRLPAAIEAKRRRQWLKQPDGAVSTLDGKTMLILGYGAIGKALARTAIAFNMKVIGLRRSGSIPAKGAAAPDTSTADVRIEGAGKLHDLLGCADIVVNVLPATPGTYHFVGASEFCLMKQGALYVSLGRGTATDEAALVEALRTRWIAGALLDVTETEPLPPDSPLWDLDNVILTGHYAGMHPAYGRLALDVALDNLARYTSGRPLRNVVDKTKGY